MDHYPFYMYSTVVRMVYGVCQVQDFRAPAIARYASACEKSRESELVLVSYGGVVLHFSD